MAITHAPPPRLQLPQAQTASSRAAAGTERKSKIKIVENSSILEFQNSGENQNC
jgi:hypothetical protein